MLTFFNDLDKLAIATEIFALFGAGVIAYYTIRHGGAWVWARVIIAVNKAKADIATVKSDVSSIGSLETRVTALEIAFSTLATQLKAAVTTPAAPPAS